MEKIFAAGGCFLAFLCIMGGMTSFVVGFLRDALRGALRAALVFVASLSYGAVLSDISAAERTTSQEDWFNNFEPLKISLPGVNCAISGGDLINGKCSYVRQERCEKYGGQWQHADLGFHCYRGEDHINIEAAEYLIEENPPLVSGYINPPSE